MLTRLSRLRLMEQTRKLSQRDVRYARLEESDLMAFESVLGKEAVVKDDIANYVSDWTRQFTGKGSVVLLPKTAEQVSAVLGYCSKRKLAVVPQAGNTGLVGGSVPLFDEIVLSTKNIRNNFEFDEASGVLTCDAGFILQDIDEKLRQKGFMMPFDLGAKGSCLIGGNIATCAGGIRLLRYGSLHAHLLGLTAVLPDENGTILKLGSPIRKDNTSLHTHHMFLGSEGQLGVITSVTMTVVPAPDSVCSAMLGISSFENCLAVLKLAKRRLAEILSSFEFLDAAAMEALEENLKLAPLLTEKSPFTILLETSGSKAEHDMEKVKNFLEECFNEGLVDDGVMADSLTEANKMWTLRESCPLAVVRDGYVYKHDVSLPLPHFYALTEEMRRHCGDLAKRVVTYGHLGDGNTHLNITSSKFDQKLYDKLYPYLYEWVADHGGSISAEHGIGQVKMPYAHFGKQLEERALVQSLKQPVQIGIELTGLSTHSLGSHRNPVVVMLLVVLILLVGVDATDPVQEELRHPTSDKIIEKYVELSMNLTGLFNGTTIGEEALHELSKKIVSHDKDPAKVHEIYEKFVEKLPEDQKKVFVDFFYDKVRLDYMSKRVDTILGYYLTKHQIARIRHIMEDGFTVGLNREEIMKVISEELTKEIGKEKAEKALEMTVKNLKVFAKKNIGVLDRVEGAFNKMIHEEL
ncbi:unnamed protein product [Caenorhabditis auriculariae]|uniref:D-2-hydroxyglutarate dehydrogenase, mitochondrial n=1 Tax=Caenorhabditis auriculariae TaxID=2777116 RepID=A0A8S1HGT2_9PELO|nr:unnamed protein product [Caenorhabditis auriculariae]